MFSKKHSIKIRKSDNVHDRYLFVDDKCWMLGTSIKDAGKRPTVLVPIQSRDELYNLWNFIYDKAEILLA